MNTSQRYLFEGGPLDGAMMDFEGIPPEQIYCSEAEFRIWSTGGSVGSGGAARTRRRLD